MYIVAIPTVIVKKQLRKFRDIGTDNRTLLEDPLYLGSGAAGIGVAMQIRTGLVAEGLTAAAARIHVLDSRGLLVAGRAHIEDYKRPFTNPRSARLVPGAVAENGPPAGLDFALRLDHF